MQHITFHFFVFSIMRMTKVLDNGGRREDKRANERSERRTINKILAETHFNKTHLGYRQVDSVIK